MVKSDDSVPVQAIGRAMALLESVAEMGTVGVSQLADRHGMPTSTVHNLLKSLAMLGYVTSSDGRYRLGPGVLLLASHLDSGRALVDLMQPTVERIASATGHAATLTTMAGQHACAVATAAGTAEIVVQPTGSARQLPLALATGRVLVALGPRQDWPGHVSRAVRAEPASSPQRWLDELARIAEVGVAVRRRPSTPAHPPQVTAVAVPVWIGSELPNYSVGVSVPWTLDGDAVAELVEVLWPEAVRLSADLGCDSPPVPRPDRETVRGIARTAIDVPPTTS
ncbi:IclR family transcriptional regulator [Pseudactinotalea suaedae]|uniref:IclR family transcriptional regulator n=1 Tax=Pseudactinotalea suaedae TaxID=1524924 RepID=UPI0013914ED9|nr:helix-turn-helix domain-containing protein [Pseudactinotalea suaedae]